MPCLASSPARPAFLDRDMLIGPCTLADIGEWTEMRRALWPDEDGLEAGAAALVGPPDPAARKARPP